MEINNEIKVIALLSGYMREVSEGAEFEKTTYKIAEQIVKLFAIPVVSLPKGTFVPNDVKLPKELKPINMNTKYYRDKLLGTNES